MKNYHIYYWKVYTVYAYRSLFVGLATLYWIRSRHSCSLFFKLIGSAVLTLSAEIHPDIICGSWWRQAFIDYSLKRWNDKVSLLTRFYFLIFALSVLSSGYCLMSWYIIFLSHFTSLGICDFTSYFCNANSHLMISLNHGKVTKISILGITSYVVFCLIYYHTMS